MSGIHGENWDVFEEASNAFEDYNWLLEKANTEKSLTCARRMSLLMYCQAIEMTAPHEILANLIRCINDNPYVFNPFAHLERRLREIPREWIPPSAKKKFEEIRKMALQAKQDGLVEVIDSFFDDNIRNVFSHSDYILTDEYFRSTEGGRVGEILVDELDKKVQNCFGFYSAFFYLHKNFLLHLARGKKYHKLPQYEVLEILSSCEDSVYGFSIHFSNGSKATFIRRKSGTKAINLGFNRDGSLYSFVGNIDKLEPIWKIDGEPVDSWDFLP